MRGNARRIAERVTAGKRVLYPYLGFAVTTFKNPVPNAAGYLPDTGCLRGARAIFNITARITQAVVAVAISGTRVIVTSNSLIPGI